MLSLFSPPFSSPNFPPLIHQIQASTFTPFCSISCSTQQLKKKPPTTTTSSSTRKEKTTKPPAPTETTTTSTVNLPPKKKVLTPIGQGTEEMEAVIMIDVMRQAGADVLWHQWNLSWRLKPPLGSDCDAGHQQF